MAHYGLSCGGRVEGRAGGCAERFGGTFGSEADIEELDATGPSLAEDCEFGQELDACDKLASLDALGSELPAYGRRCGGRTMPASTSCVERLRPPALAKCADESGSVDSCIRAALPEPTPAEAEDAELVTMLHDLAYDCIGLAMVKCDLLAEKAPQAAYEGYYELGKTCGQRPRESSGSCADEPVLARIGGATDPSTVPDEIETRLRELKDACDGDEYDGCAELASLDDGTLYDEYREYGRTCGGLDAGDRPQACVEALAAADARRGTPIGVTTTTPGATSEPPAGTEALPPFQPGNGDDTDWVLAGIGGLVALFGAIVLLWLHDRPGGEIELFGGFKVSSAGAGLPLIALGLLVILLAFGVVWPG